MSAVSIIIRAKNEASATFDRVKGEIKGFSEDGQKAMSGMKAANDAMSKAMRGDLVGAAQSAATAFKSLWAVVISNPILLGLAAATTAIALLAKSHMDAAAAAREQAEEQRKLNDEILRIKKHDPQNVKKEVAGAMVESGDKAGLEKMRDQYREKVAEEENKVRVWGFSTDGLKAAQESLDIYDAALVELEKKQKKAAEDKARADEKAASEKLETDKRAAKESADFMDGVNAELRRLDEQAAEARAAALQTIRREEFEEGVRLAEEEAKAKEQAAKDALDFRKKAAEEGARAEEKASRASGRTLLGWHVNMVSQQTRRMSNSIGSLSQLRGSAFKSWNTKEGRDSIEVKGIDKTNTLLEDIGRKLA